MRRHSIREWRWTLLSFAIALAATAGLYQTRGWIWLGVPPLGAERVPFSDAAAQLTAADVCANGHGQRLARVCFVPSLESPTHSQTYEPWITFQRLGLTGAKYIPISVAMIVFFYLAFCLAFRPASGGEAALLLLFLFSAAVQLAVERANFDLLTSAMLCLAARLLNDRRRGWAIAGCLALGVDTSLKIYTGLSSICAWIARRDLRASFAVLAVLVTVAAVAVVGLDSVLVLGHGAPEGQTRFSTGAHWLWRQRGFAWMAGAASCALVAGLVAWRALRGNAPLDSVFARHPQRSALFKIAFLTAVPLFLLKDSYDYRFVLWLPCLALPIALLRDPLLAPAWRRFCVTLLSLSAIVFCAELLCVLLDRVAQHTVATWPDRLIEGAIMLKQFSVWVVAALLSALFALSIADRRDRFASTAPRS